MTLIREVTSIEWLEKVQNGDVDGFTIVNKFGAVTADASTLTPICTNKNYPTPMEATGLTIVSTSTNDAAAGTHARKVEIQGLDENWEHQAETITMNGTTPVASVNQWLRIYRMKVTEGGVYVDLSNPFSQDGEIELKDVSDNSWGIIARFADTDGKGLGQSQIGMFSIPSGITAQMLNYHMTIDSAKAVDIYYFVREGADIVTAPYGTKKLKSVLYQVSGHLDVEGQAPLTKIIGPADIGFLCFPGVGGAGVSIDYQLLMKEI